jgi:hypothetical protein
MFRNPYDNTDSFAYDGTGAREKGFNGYNGYLVNPEFDPILPPPPIDPQVFDPPPVRLPPIENTTPPIFNTTTIETKPAVRPQTFKPRRHYGFNYGVVPPVIQQQPAPTPAPAESPADNTIFGFDRTTVFLVGGAGAALVLLYFATKK